MSTNPRLLLLAAGMSGAIGCMIWSGRSAADIAAPAGLYTLAQAQAGKRYMEGSCTQCHLATLKGRVGDPGEEPAVESLRPEWEKFVDSAAGIVPPLVGEEFIAKFGEKSLSQFAWDQIRGAAQSFGPDGVPKDDPVAYLDMTAYVLQMNGYPAGKQPLTSDSATRLSAMRK